jgi:hypothetical protein
VEKRWKRNRVKHKQTEHDKKKQMGREVDRWKWVKRRWKRIESDTNSHSMIKKLLGHEVDAVGSGWSQTQADRA